MKMNLKKLFAVVMILTMVFAMSSVAFANADTTISVTVEFYDGGEWLMSESVQIDPNSMTTSDWNSLYTIPSLVAQQTYDSNILMNNQRPSVMDATIKCLQDMGADDGTEVYWDYWDPTTQSPGVTNNSVIRGGYVTCIFGTDTETDTSQSTGSLWVGNAWLYSIVRANGTVVNPELYATNVALENGMTIKWDYTYGVEEPIN